MQPDRPATARILRNNLLAVLGAAVLLGLLAKPTDGVTVMVFVVVYVGLALVNVLLGIANFRRGPAAYFLSALLVFLVGFGSCAGMLALGGLGKL